MPKGFRLFVKSNHLPSLAPAVRYRLARVVREAGMNVQAKAQRVIEDGPKTGRIYANRDSKYHQASAPGEAPATNTGNLLNSIHLDTSKSESHLQASVNVTAEYGALLEFGTVNIQPRPFLGLAVEQESKIFAATVTTAIRSGLESGR